MDVDRLRWLVRERKHLTLDGAVEIAKAAPDLLNQIESLDLPVCEICGKPIRNEVELLKGSDGCDFHRACANRDRRGEPRLSRTT